MILYISSHRTLVLCGRKLSLLQEVLLPKAIQQYFSVLPTIALFSAKFIPTDSFSILAWTRAFDYSLDPFTEVKFRETVVILLGHRLGKKPPGRSLQIKSWLHHRTKGRVNP